MSTPRYTGNVEELEDRSAGRSTWVPGDNLYLSPRGPGAGQQYRRPLFQVLDEDRHMAINHLLKVIRCETGLWCPGCWVAWTGGGRCWACDGVGATLDEADPRAVWPQ